MPGETPPKGRLDAQVRNYNKAFPLDDEVKFQSEMLNSLTEVDLGHIGTTGKKKFVPSNIIPAFVKDKPADQHMKEPSMIDQIDKTVPKKKALAAGKGKQGAKKRCGRDKDLSDSDSDSAEESKESEDESESEDKVMPGKKFGGPSRKGKTELSDIKKSVPNAPPQLKPKIPEEKVLGTMKSDPVSQPMKSRRQVKFEEKFAKALTDNSDFKALRADVN